MPLDGRPHLSPTVRQWIGDSRGRWEADSLIIDTTNFSPNSNFLGSADNLHLVERFSARGSRSGRLPGHGRRSEDVDETLDGPHSSQAGPSQAVRVCVPRGKWRRDDEHPRNSPRGGAVAVSSRTDHRIKGARRWSLASPDRQYDTDASFGDSISTTNEDDANDEVAASGFGRRGHPVRSPSFCQFRTCHKLSGRRQRPEARGSR